MSSRQNSQKWKDLRRKFLDSLTDNRCAGCGEAVDLSLSGMNPKGPTVDHIKSVKHFPELEYEMNNLQLMCRTCNTSKHAGPRSRQRRYETGIKYEQKKYPGQTLWLRWNDEHGIYFNNGGLPWSVNDYLVTFDNTGNIVSTERFSG